MKKWMIFVAICVIVVGGFVSDISKVGAHNGASTEGHGSIVGTQHFAYEEGGGPMLSPKIS